MTVIDPSERKQERTAAAAACVLLAAAAAIPLPYGFYGLMRWLCVGIFSFLGVREYRRGAEPRAWIFFTLAGLYNPIVPVHLGKPLWQIVNVATVVVVAQLVFRSGRR